MVGLWDLEFLGSGKGTCIGGSELWLARKRAAKKRAKQEAKLVDPSLAEGSGKPDLCSAMLQRILMKTAPTN